MVVPYPPGIPILMPGESAGPPTDRCLSTSPRSRPSTSASPASNTTSTASNATPGGNYAIECLTLEPAAAHTNGSHPAQKPQLVEVGTGTP
jgi:hypothetical protein